MGKEHGGRSHDVLLPLWFWCNPHLIHYFLIDYVKIFNSSNIIHGL